MLPGYHALYSQCFEVWPTSYAESSARDLFEYLLFIMNGKWRSCIVTESFDSHGSKNSFRKKPNNVTVPKTNNESEHGFL